MTEWMEATDRDRLATSADFATTALERKFGSLQAARQKLGSMDNLLPYAIEALKVLRAEGATRMPQRQPGSHIGPIPR